MEAKSPISQEGRRRCRAEGVGQDGVKGSSTASRSFCCIYASVFRLVSYQWWVVLGRTNL